MKIEILKTETYEDNAEIVDIYGQGCNYPTRKGVDGYQVDFNIRATNQAGETKNFHIVFQSADRSDNIRAYNGYEMKVGDWFGCDADESSMLVEFMDDDSCLDTLEKAANKLCHEWFEDNK